MKPLKCKMLMLKEKLLKQTLDFLHTQPFIGGYGFHSKRDFRLAHFFSRWPYALVA